MDLAEREAGLWFQGLMTKGNRDKKTMIQTKTHQAPIRISPYGEEGKEKEMEFSVCTRRRPILRTQN